MSEAITIKELSEDNYVFARLSNANSQASFNYSRELPSYPADVDFKKIKIRFSVDVLYAIK